MDNPTHESGPSPDVRFASRKFILASVSLVASIAGLFLDKVSGNEFYMCLLAILGCYGTTNWLDKRDNG